MLERSPVTVSLKTFGLAFLNSSGQNLICSIFPKFWHHPHDSKRRKFFQKGEPKENEWFPNMFQVFFHLSLKAERSLALPFDYQFCHFKAKKTVTLPSAPAYDGEFSLGSPLPRFPKSCTRKRCNERLNP
jgi:hypothetical protein